MGGESVRDEIVTILGLLQATKGHLGAWDVLLWVLEVGELQAVSRAFSFWKVKRPLDNAPECHFPRRRPSPCWRRCRSSPRPGRIDDRRDRSSWGRSCWHRLSRGCGIERSGSMAVSFAIVQRDGLVCDGMAHLEETGTLLSVTGRERVLAHFEC